MSARRTPDPTWDAWLAGFIDGEGSIVISRISPVTAKRRNAQWGVTVKAANTHEPTMQRIFEREGGHLHRYGGVNRPVYHWFIAGPTKTKALLERLRPYFVTKANQAWLMLEFLAQRTVSMGSHPIPPEEAALREGYRLAIVGLNHQRNADRNNPRFRVRMAA